MSPIRPAILYVDCDSTSSAFARAWVARNAPECRLVCSESAAEALDRVTREAFDLYLFEYCLGDLTGPELCSKVRQIHSDATVVICSSLGREVDREMAMRAGASDYLVKPDDFHKLSRLVRTYLGRITPTKARAFHKYRRAAGIF